MFEDTRISIFLAVVEERSFTQAARKLGISQPAVSQNIAELERILGTKLLDRTRTSMSLTEDGVKFKEYAEQICYWYRVASEAFRGGLPEPLRGSGKKQRELYIGVGDEFRVHLVPEGSEAVDIDIADRDGGLSIRIEQKKTEPEKGSALSLF